MNRNRANQNLAIRIHAFGGVEQLRFEASPVSAPAAGEVQVQQTAIGVNFIDTYHRSGLYPIPLPGVLGQEAAGIVVALGSDAHGFAPGDRVAYCTAGTGAYTQIRNVAAAKLLKLPDHVSDVQAAASLLKGMTCEYLLRRTYPVKAGDVVLFHAAAGGVGSLAVQWLKRLGATVIGTVGSAEKASQAKLLGCDHVVLYRERDFVAEVLAITQGRGVSVVYDSIGKDTLDRSLEVLKPRGMLVAFGNASGRPNPIDPLTLSAKGSLFLTRPKLADYVATRGELETSAAAWFAVLADGVQVSVSARYCLADAAAAQQALESRASTGCIVLMP